MLPSFLRPCEPRAFYIRDHGPIRLTDAVEALADSIFAPSTPTTTINNPQAAVQTAGIIAPFDAAALLQPQVNTPCNGLNANVTVDANLKTITGALFFELRRYCEFRISACRAGFWLLL